GVTGIKILNTASLANNGWRVGHLQDASSERNGAFSLLEESSGLTENERLVVLPGGNVGISEPAPDTKLHVSRPVADPDMPVDLRQGTGLAVFGPITDNIVMDYRGLQARHGSYVSSTLSLSVSELNIQRLGGDILIHGDATIPADKKILLSST